VLCALTHQPLASTAFLSFSLPAAVSFATSSTSSCSASFPVLHHTSYHPTTFISTSIASISYMLHLVTSPPSTIHHHARKEDCWKRSLSVRHCPQYCCQRQHPHQQQQLHHHHHHQLQKSIAKLITLTTLLPDSLLGLIWKHAFWEGLKEGFKRETELFKDKDVKQAFHEGADQGQIMGILAEREEWKAEGHGQ